MLGLIGPVGADLSLVRDTLAAELLKVGYTTHRIRVSSLLHEIEKYSSLTNLEGESEESRVQRHMEAGSELREKTKRGDTLALMAVSQIRQIRAQANASKEEIPAEERPNMPLHRTAYIVDSLKHPMEVESLRDIYGRAFLVVAAYSPREKRVEDMAERIMTSVHSSDRNQHRAAAEKLIKIDEDEEGKELGQNVSSAFPLADCFVDVSDRIGILPAIERFIRLIFNHPYLTPTRDEFAMFHAQSAALRSADLSRQVGAVIATKGGDIVAIGCNEVPSAQGGLYWCDDPNDARDFRLGTDKGAVVKREVLAELLQKLKTQNWFSSARSAISVDELTKSLLHGEDREILRGAQVTNLIEFGRTVHAEMAAITDASRRGVKIDATTLYTTTFPCHLCARHIIAAGIVRVVFIEPYSKSKALELFSDSMEVDRRPPDSHRVSFQPFVGIAPRQYMNLFQMRGPRKAADGRVIEWGGTNQKPKLKRFVLSYITLEKIVEASIPKILESAGLRLQS
jgi:cytidine deaminase